MTTFCGCDTATMDELSTVFGDRAARLETLMAGAGRAVTDARWTGPDAEWLREQAERLVEDAIGLFEAIRELGELLRQESAQQTDCSQADDAGTWEDPLRSMRTEWPGSVREADVSSLMTAPAARQWGPMIGGPFMVRPLPSIPPPQPQPDPDGEEFALDPQILADAQKDRRIALGGIPLLGTAQMLMGAHGAVGRLHDNLEQIAEDSGVPGATAVASIARTPHTLTGIALGEKSVLGQVLGSVDRQLANVVQTSGEISSALGDGDWAGAVRAGERGAFRHADAALDTITAHAGPAVVEAGTELTGSAADVVEPLSPAAAAHVREVESVSRDFGERIEGAHHWLTDGERHYDLRRQYAPMPWDARS